jgi:hypothetical protein
VKPNGQIETSFFLPPQADCNRSGAIERLWQHATT